MDIIPDIKKDNLSKQQIEYLQEQERHNTFLGSMVHNPGHTLFSFNKVTKEIKKAELVNEVSIGLNDIPITKKKLQVEADCFYEEALNKKNFIKRLIRYGLLEKEEE